MRLVVRFALQPPLPS